MTTTTPPRIYIVKGLASPWAESVYSVHDSISAALRELSITEEPVVLPALSNLLEMESPVRKRRDCVICHLERSEAQTIMELKTQYLWIFVSGGRHVVTDEFRSQFPRGSAIWFQGAYGREDHFAFWIMHWASEKFDPLNFAATEDALLLAAYGPTLHLMRLRELLQPLWILVEGGAGLIGINSYEEPQEHGAENPQRLADVIVSKLSTSVCTIIKDASLLDSLSSQATLLDGWLLQQNISLQHTDAIRKALEPFIPKDRGHFGSYNPRLDMDLIHLGEGKLSHGKVCHTIAAWHERLQLLFSLEVEQLFKNASPAQA